jgi:putative NIF3 family GTP cyclohydrolase 1 type 2
LSVKVDSRYPTIFNPDTTIYPFIYEEIKKNNSGLECLDSNSAATSVTTLVACLEETQIPERISTENNIIISQRIGHKMAINYTQSSLRESGKRIRVSYPLQGAFEED